MYDVIRIFYDVLGGARHYARQPAIVKHICKGLKRTLIARNFKTAGQLRRFLETTRWQGLDGP